MIQRIESKGFFDRLIETPAAMGSLMIAVLGQAIFSIYFQVVNNEQQAAQLIAQATALRVFQEQVTGLQTPLSQRVFKLEDRVDENARRHDDLNKRIDAIDIAGTRGLSLIASNQQRVMGQVDRLGERLIMLDKRVGDVEAKAVIIIQTRVDSLEASIKRLEQILEKIGSPK